MKFVIQKIDGEVRHDFAFTLLESIRFHKWLDKTSDFTVKYVEFLEEIPDPDMIYPMTFKHVHQRYVPIGSVDFVTEYLNHFYGITPKPINVPEELFRYANRPIFNGDHESLKGCIGKYFVKSNDKIKHFTEVVDCRVTDALPLGNYQISDYIENIVSEWRAFVHQGNLVGLQNYSGDYTVFPNVEVIKTMITDYKSAPVAYTLDVAVTDTTTVIIECHDFFSCGLYGFSDLMILPFMFNKWFKNYTKDMPVINYNDIWKR